MPRLHRAISWPRRKFIALVLRKRIGKNKWSAHLIFGLLSILDLLEFLYINTQDTGNYDHYIPKFLLRRFRISEKGAHSNSLFTYTLKSKLVERKSIDDVAGEIDFDVSKANGIPSDFVNKKIFAEFLEPIVSRIVKHINTGNNDLTYLEANTLAVYMGHQITRVPAFRSLLLKIFSIGISDGRILYSEFGDKKALREKVAFNSIGITYDQILRTKPFIKVDGGKPQAIMISLLIASVISEKIYRDNSMHIIDIPQDSGKEFVISDNPVVFMDFERGTVLPFVPWWEIGTRDFLIAMPISRNKAILYSRVGRKPTETEQNSIAELINFAQYACARKEIYSNNEKTILAHLNKYKTELEKFRLMFSSED